MSVSNLFCMSVWASWMLPGVPVMVIIFSVPDLASLIIMSHEDCALGERGRKERQEGGREGGRERGRKEVRERETQVHVSG